MELNEYQEAATKTAIYPDCGLCTTEAINYTLMALCGEVGEMANKFKKVLRGDDVSPQMADRFSSESLPRTVAGRREVLKKEAGDVLWYLSQLARELGWSLEELAQENLIKLRARQQEDKIKGTGDDR